MAARAIQRVVITGGNKGIGYALALRLLRDCPDAFVLLGSRDAARGAAAVARIAAECEGWRSRVELLLIDVTDRASVVAAVAAVAATHGGAGCLHALVNNAAVGFGLPLADTLAANITGARLCTDAFLPLIRRDGGRVVNIGSGAGPMFLEKCSPAVQVGVIASWPRNPESHSQSPCLARPQCVRRT